MEMGIKTALTAHLNPVRTATNKKAKHWMPARTQGEETFIHRLSGWECSPCGIRWRTLENQAQIHPAVELDQSWDTQEPKSAGHRETYTAMNVAHYSQ